MMGSLFLLESKGKCLFCREKVNNATTAETSNDSYNLTESDNVQDYQEDVQYSLRHICHYLKENLKHKMLIFREGEKTTSYNRSKGFQITLCKNCSVVVERLTNLCQELELIQMKVDHAVKEMMQIITATPPPPSLQSTTEDESSDTLTFDSLLREKTRKLSISALQKSRHPQIKLSKLDVDADNENPDWELPLQSLSVCIEEPPQEDPKLEKTEEKKFDMTNFCYPHPTLSSSSSGRMNNNINTLEKNEELQCPFCSCSLLDSNRLRFHTLTRHPEHFFYSAKMEGVSEGEFQSACQLLLSQETKARLPNGFFKCRHCAVSKKEKRRLIGHMVDFHYNELVEELNTLQKNGVWEMKGFVNTVEEGSGGFQINCANIIHPVIKEIIQHLPKNTLEKDGRVVFTCQLCRGDLFQSQKAFPGRLSLERHVISHHVEHFFSAFRKPNIPSELFKSHCKRVLEDLKNESRNSSGTFFCPFCTSAFGERQPLQRHLIKIHYDVLGTKLEEMQAQDKGMEEAVEIRKERETIETDPSNTTITSSSSNNNNNSLACKICGVEFNSSIALAGHVSKRHSFTAALQQAKLQTAKANGPKCPHCNYRFSSNTSLNRHLKTTCDKLRTTGALVATATSTTRENVTQKPKKCKLCAATFLNIFSFSRHMKQVFHPQHQSTLRLTCRHCGMYFSCKSNLTRHLKRSCEGLKALGLLLPDRSVSDAGYEESSSVLASLLQNEGSSSSRVEFEETNQDNVLVLHSGADYDLEDEVEMDVKEEPIMHEELSDYTTSTFQLFSSMNNMDMEQVDVCNDGDNGAVNFYNESVEEDPLQM